MGGSIWERGVSERSLGRNQSSSAPRPASSPATTRARAHASTHTHTHARAHTHAHAQSETTATWATHHYGTGTEGDGPWNLFHSLGRAGGAGLGTVLPGRDPSATREWGLGPGLGRNLMGCLGAQAQPAHTGAQRKAAAPRKPQGQDPGQDLGDSAPWRTEAQ